MEKFLIIEDKGILKRTAPIMIILGILAAFTGFYIFFYFVGGAIGGALLGGLGFGGITAASTGFKRLAMIKKPERTIVYADEAGVRVAGNAFTNAETFFPWQEIQSASAAKKEFLLILKNPDNYINSLNNKKDISAAKQFMKRFNTPVCVSTSTCKESSIEIVNKINKMLEASAL